MKKLGYVIASASMAMAVSTTTFADEPTRGFALEQGTVAKQGTVSVDVNDNFKRGGIRIGLDVGELVLNSGKMDVAGFEGNGTDAIFKYALPTLEGLSELKHSWAVYGGLSYLDDDASDTKYTNFMAGVAFTGEVEKLSFTVAPELIVNDLIDETYVDINLGAYFDLGQTKYGTFKPGAEIVASTLSGKDTEVYLGVKWGIKDNVNLDIIPVSLGNNDVTSLPGQLRLNISF